MKRFLVIFFCIALVSCGTIPRATVVPEASRIVATVMKQKAAISEQKTALVSARERAERIKEENPTLPQIVPLIDDLKTAEARNLFLEISNESLQSLAKENESSAENLSASLNAKEKELEKAKQAAATANVYRRWIIGIAAALVLFIVGKTILTIYRPPLLG